MSALLSSGSEQGAYLHFELSELMDKNELGNDLASLSR
jgi:hypothetical protein